MFFVGYVVGLMSGGAVRFAALSVSHLALCAAAFILGVLVPEQTVWHWLGSLPVGLQVSLAIAGALVLLGVFVRTACGDKD